jgi:hypothetical protein
MSFYFGWRPTIAATYHSPGVISSVVGGSLVLNADPCIVPPMPDSVHIYLFNTDFLTLQQSPNCFSFNSLMQASAISKAPSWFPTSLHGCLFPYPNPLGCCRPGKRASTSLLSSPLSDVILWPRFLAPIEISLVSRNPPCPMYDNYFPVISQLTFIFSGHLFHPH